MDKKLGFEFYMYAAGYGFTHPEHPTNYNKECADLVLSRTVKFMQRHLQTANSTDKDSVFCDDPNCSYVGKLSILVPETVKEPKVSIQVSLTCQGTKLEAEACLPQQRAINFSICLDFLDTFQAGFDMSDTIVVE
ncbi:hypothetical protein MAR_005134 [Mya arenaria]|uniref:Uncharacterized protein n=1 Tax=Mya arenaria TaxID=6604 RepID=A0ABY7F105_MYAAR|nr:hypothetical protein MAR_005134 [Mya arenaria]